MSNLILETVVHPDPGKNVVMPRFQEEMLGKAYSVRDVGNSCVKGRIVNDPVANSLVKGDLNVQEAAFTSHLVQTEQDMHDALAISGELSISYLMISGSGKGVFEREVSRQSKTLTIVQSGYRVVEVKHLDSGKLQSPDALQKGDLIHSQLSKDFQNMGQYLQENGWHYVTKVFMGCRAARSITYECSSALERKKIEAEVKGKLGLGPLSISFEASYRSGYTEETKKLHNKSSIQALGGDPMKLQMKLAVPEIREALASQGDASWSEYLESASQYPAVVRVEVEPVSSSFVPLLGLSEEEKKTFQANVKKAQARREELSQQKITLQEKLRSMEQLIKSAGVQDGACKMLMKAYFKASKRFTENHIEFVIQKLTKYLLQTPMDIIAKGSCSEGGSENPSYFDLSDDDFLVEKGSLDKSQMDEFFVALTSGSREPVPKFAGNILWDGPWIFSEPVGVPNEVLFYHEDVVLSELSEIERNQQWKFKVPGEDWDLSTSSPLLDEDTLIHGNRQFESEGNVINLEKLPAYFKKHVYSSSMLYENGHEYTGDWLGGKWNGKGCLKYPVGHEVKNIHAVWSQGGIEGDVHIQFTKMSGDMRATYDGAVLFDRGSWSVQPHGMGKMEFSDGAMLQDWQWSSGKAVVDSAEAATKILGFKWFVDLPAGRLYFKHLDLIEAAMTELKDMAFYVQEQHQHKDGYEKVEHKLKQLIGEGRAIGDVLHFSDLFVKCFEAEQLIQTIRDEKYIFKYVIMLGNPGVGKSSFGSGLVGGGFDSGYSSSTGMTQFFKAIARGGLVVLDTPGLADVKMAEEAASEITKALKSGGEKGAYRVIMMLTLEEGRLRPMDVVTFNNVLEAMPDEVEVTPGVIVNKVDPGHSCPSEKDWLNLCQALFTKPKNKKHVSARAQWRFIERDESLQGQMNHTLAPHGSREWLLTLPTCHLDSRSVKDVQAIDADQLVTAQAEMLELKKAQERKDAEHELDLKNMQAQIDKKIEAEKQLQREMEAERLRLQREREAEQKEKERLREEMLLRQILDEMVSSFAEQCTDTKVWLAGDNTRRNELAKQAADNNHSDAVRIASHVKEKSVVLAELADKSHHTEIWKDKFAAWGGHDNGYASYVHGQGQKYYNEAIRRIESLK